MVIANLLVAKKRCFLRYNDEMFDISPKNLCLRPIYDI